MPDPSYDVQIVPPGAVGGSPNAPLYTLPQIGVPGAGSPSGTVQSPAGWGGWIAQLYDLYRGVSGQDINQAQRAAYAADPFASQRPQYQTALQTTFGQQPSPALQRLTDLLTNPGSFTADPGYQFAKEQGLEGVARHGNAMFGTTRSGNTAIALDQYGTGFAEQAYDTRVNQLLGQAGLESSNYNTRIGQLLQASGANNNYGPMAASRALEQGYANQNSSLAGGARGIDQLLSMLFGNGQNGGVLSGATNFIRQLFGGSGTDFSAISGSDAQFLQSLGLDPSSLDGSSLANIFDTSGTAPIMDYSPIGVGGDFGIDPSLLDPSTTNIIGDLGSGIDLGSLFGG